MTFKEFVSEAKFSVSPGRGGIAPTTTPVTRRTVPSATTRISSPATPFPASSFRPASYPTTSLTIPSPATTPNITPGVTSPMGDINITPTGKVNPNELNAYIRDWVSRSSLNGFVPADGEQYGLDGSPQSWADFFTKLAKKESSFDVNRVGDVGKYEGGSRGLFQLSPKDALNHKLQPTPFSFEQLRDPLTNTNAALTIAEILLKRDGIVKSRQNGSWLGLSAYWGPLRTDWKP